MMRKAKKFNVLLLIILLIGAGVRFWGIGYGLPHVTVSPDEADVVNIALSFGAMGFNPERFVYPTLYLYFLFGVYGVYFLLGRATGIFSSLDEFAFISRFDPSEFYLINRVIVALMGVATVYVVYKIADLVFGKKSGIIAAFFMSLTYLHVRESHFGKLDVPMVFLIMVSMYYIIKSFKEKNLKDYLMAGFVTGLAVSTKYAGALMVFPVILVYLFNNFSKKGFKGLLIAKKLIGFGAMSVLGFFLGTPFALVEFNQFVSDFVVQAGLISTGNTIKVAPAWWYYLRYSLFYGMGWPLMLCSIAGIIWFFRKDYKQALVLFLFPGIYFFILGRGGYTFSRYIFPVVPFLVIIASGFLSAIDEKLSIQLSKRIANRAILLIAVLVMLPSISSVTAYNRLVSKKDSRVISSEWIEDSYLEGGSVYQTGSLWGKLQLNPSLSSLEKRFNKLNSLPETNNNKWESKVLSLSIEEYKEKAIEGFESWSFDESLGRFYYEDRIVEELPDLIVVEESPLEFFSGVPDNIPGMLSEYYKQEVAFEVIDVENQRNFFEQQDAFYVPFAGFKGVERPGPNIYIYRKIIE